MFMSTSATMQQPISDTGNCSTILNSSTFVNRNNNNDSCSIIDTKRTSRTSSYESTEDSTSVDDQSEGIEINSCSMDEIFTNEKQNDSSQNQQQEVTSQRISIATTLSPISTKPTHVRWGTIQMRIHPFIPGDHPDTREGPPLTMDWIALEEYIMDIDGYEAKRPPRMKAIGLDLRIGPIDRLNILRREGIAEEEIVAAMESVRYTRKLRRRTTEPWRQQFLIVEEIKESIVRKMSRVLNPEIRPKLTTRY